MTTPAGPSFRPNTSRCAELGRRHLLLAIVQRLHRPHRVAQLRRLLEPLACGGVDHPRRAASRRARRSCLRGTAACRRPRALYSLGEQIVSTHGAMQRLMSYSRHGRAALAGDHLVARPDAEQPVRQRHRLARELRRQERAGVEAAVALDARARPARAETPRWSSAAGRDSSCRRAAGCCISGVRCLIRLFSSASASTTESVTMTSRRGDFVEQRVGLGLDAVGAEIVADAVAQRPRLADVNRVAGRVEVQIDSGLLGQPGDLILEFVDGHTLLCRVSMRVWNLSIIAHDLRSGSAPGSATLLQR